MKVLHNPERSYKILTKNVLVDNNKFKLVPFTLISELLPQPNYSGCVKVCILRCISNASIEVGA